MVVDGTAVDAFGVAQDLRMHVAGATTGVAELRAGEDKHGLIRRADLALLAAKRTHREVLVYSADMESMAGTDLPPDERHLSTLATALARAVDAKDSYTRSHCETVAELCVLIAGELGLDTDRVARIRIAGLLHDVGKIGISDAILQKPAALTVEEAAIMRTHPDLGAHIVSAAELYEEAGWILHHHERLDGRGYPDGLTGGDVPLESRIIMVADAFEAMTSDRPYRPRRPVDEALAELERHSGTQFDPECIAALCRILLPASTPGRSALSAAARASARVLPVARGFQIDVATGREARRLVDASGSDRDRRPSPIPEQPRAADSAEATTGPVVLVPAKVVAERDLEALSRRGRERRGSPWVRRQTPQWQTTTSRSGPAHAIADGAAQTSALVHLAHPVR